MGHIPMVVLPHVLSPLKYALWPIDAEGEHLAVWDLLHSEDTGQPSMQVGGLMLS